MAIFVSIKYWEIGYIGLTDPKSICHEEKVIRKKQLLQTTTKKYCLIDATLKIQLFR